MGDGDGEAGGGPGGWRMGNRETGVWSSRMGDGGWGMENVGWGMGDGRWRMGEAGVCVVLENGGRQQQTCSDEALGPWQF